MTDLYLTTDKIEELTDGKWENLNEELYINEFHHTFHYLEKNDVFVVVSDNWHKSVKPNEHKIKDAIRKGISAIIVKEELQLDVSIPVLRVKSSLEAIKKLSHYVNEVSTAKKVIVTGSFGKTSFKIHLHHILKSQFSFYVRHNSANYPPSNYCNMASMKKENEIFSIEIPISKKSNLIRRAQHISAEIAVLTSIGHEHIERFKTIENIIKHKLLIINSLKSNGKLLVNATDKYYKLVQDELKNYNEIDVKTFGTQDSNAYIISREFRDFGWDIVAKVEEHNVSYRLAVFDLYAPNASLGVILCAYYLGADIHKAAQYFSSIKNFDSSGNFYSVKYREKKFYLYNQSKRGGIEGYEAFFKTLSFLKKENGRKILVTSEFVDYADGEISLVDINYFKKLINEADIKVLFTVEKFTEHINVIDDKSIWKEHSIDWNNLKDKILDEIKENDILCIKGIYESKLSKFIRYIFSLEDFTVLKRYM